ncbi:hypothetical protein OGAPHI_003812 [Ogataea philodendri]|uniref:Uncharacterized protein n=1 Tax=Ogataea philodendri TaxID=1378263 RepID=A0A9P8P6M7_9ASCO|nr:uncharacterized protein OGAPHI_003812 [Ogataea philodendri]KAH3665624.1 hypothetical protein OGAPHI_003812 [Ogataea philodendri]
MAKLSWSVGFVCIILTVVYLLQGTFTVPSHRIGSHQLVPVSPRENATFFSLVRNSELSDMLRSIKNVEQRFNRHHHYHWVFANNEPFTKQFRHAVSSACSGTVEFAVIPEKYWKYPDWIDQARAAEVRKEMRRKHIKYGDNESYRHMCRFFSGFFYKMEALQRFRYYWRVEPDIEFRCNIAQDPFRVLREENKVYGFTLTPLELHTTVETLWNVTQEYASSYPERIAPDNNMGFLSDDGGASYNMCHFWSNFEVGDLDFFRSDAYEHFFNYIDRKGGIFYERWGDAPLHTVAVSLLVPYTKLHYFAGTGYFHAPNLQCDGPNWLLEQNECICFASEDSAWSGGSCLTKFFDIHRLERPEAAPTTPYTPIHKPTKA